MENEITVENVSSISNNSRDSFYESDSKASSSGSSTSSSMDSDDNKTEFDIRNKKDVRKVFSFILNRLEALEYLLNEEKSRNSVLISRIQDLDSQLTKINTEIEEMVINRTRSNLNNDEVDILSTKINDVSLENKKLKNNFYKLLDLRNEVFDMDCRLIECEQYSRRESLVISGIPNSVLQKDLEKEVIFILNSIGCRVTSYDISACHRLGRVNQNSKYPPRTIIRFTNRKIVIFCLERRDRLNEIKDKIKMNLRFYENLCDANEEVLRSCKLLKENNIIYDYYLRNGFVKIIVNQGNRPFKIHHPELLEEKFSDFFDNK